MTAQSRYIQEGEFFIVRKWKEAEFLRDFANSYPVAEHPKGRYIGHPIGPAVRVREVKITDALACSRSELGPVYVVTGSWGFEKPVELIAVCQCNPSSEFQRALVNRKPGGGTYDVAVKNVHLATLQELKDAGIE